MPTHSEDSELTSLSLLQRVQLNDAQAWRRFVALYGPIVYRWVCHAGLSHSDADEITQDVFLAVIQNIGRFERDATGHSLRGWLWTVTHNKVRDRFRDRRDEATARGGSSALQQLEQFPKPIVMENIEIDGVTVELAHRAMQLIQTDFEPNTWQAFWELAVNGRSGPDVAADLGLSLHAVYKAKSRVLQKLRVELAGLLE